MIGHDAKFIREYGFYPGSDPVDPVVKTVFYLGPILFATGYALLGLGLLKIGAYPAPALWAVIAGAFVSVVYAVGIAWIGFLLVTGKPVRA